jgi:MFS family permease
MTSKDAEARSARVPWRSSTVQVVLASTLLAPLGVPLVAPTLPVIRDTFALTDAQASLLISTYFLAGIVLSPFIGMFADRVGRKRVLVSSLLVFGVSGIPLVFAPNFETVLAVRVVQGVAAAGIFITTVTIVGDAFEGTQRNAVLGVNNAVLSAGAAAFPVLGGALVAISWNAPFAAYLLGVPLGLVAVRYLEESDGERETAGSAYLRGAATALAGSQAAVLYGAAFMTEVLLFGPVLTVLPFLLTASYGLSPATIGLVLAAGEGSSVVVSAMNGRFAKHASNHGLIALGFACNGVGLLGMWLAPSPLFVGLATLVVGAGLGLSMPAVDAAISDVVSARHRAGALSIRNSTTFLGRSVGPVLFAGLAVATDYHTLLLAAAVVALASGPVAVLAPGRDATGRTDLEEVATDV